MNKFFNLFIKITVSLLLFCGVVTAEYIPPSSVNVKTKTYHAALQKVITGEFSYLIHWQGIPVANAWITVDQATCGNLSCAKVKIRVATGDFISFFYKMRHTSEALFYTSPIRAVSFFSQDWENRREKTRSVRFKKDGEIEAESWKKGEDKVFERFNSENFTLDPVTAAFLAKSLPLNVGNEIEVDVFNGKHRYLITFSVQKLEEIVIKGVARDAYVVQPAILKLTDSEGEPRFKSAKLWLSADDRRDILKIESKVWIGSVEAELLGWKAIARENLADDKNSWQIAKPKIKEAGLAHAAMMEQAAEAAAQ